MRPCCLPVCACVLRADRGKHVGRLHAQASLDGKPMAPARKLGTTGTAKPAPEPEPEVPHVPKTARGLMLGPNAVASKTRTLEFAGDRMRPLQVGFRGLYCSHWPFVAGQLKRVPGRGRWEHGRWERTHATSCSPCRQQQPQQHASRSTG